MATAFFTHPDFFRHEMGAHHPECPQRLAAIDDWLLASGIDHGLERLTARAATVAELERAHSPKYVREMMAALEVCAHEGTRRVIDPDTSANPYTLSAALHGAGAAVEATDLVIDGRYENAFCAVRPPGHHATRDAAMGFCFFNNVAVAARHALEARRLKRVAIVDFDVHHGNGTEDIVAGDPRVLMVSIFQHPLYPGNGVEPLGKNMVNVPVPPYTRGPEVREIVEDAWVPALAEFRPEMLFVSAGFDAHRDDELAQLGLVEADYEWITRRLKDVAAAHAKGRIVSCLEGGYALHALAHSVGQHLRVLAGI
ncbi:MAG: histone deacetylase family protein [Pelomonas sp.]|nr:histone deacetylase family protein [Roseateles sp.]